MRTTIDLDRPLLDRAKCQAARRGQTLSQLVSESVSSYLASQPADEEEPFELITCGEPGGYAPTPREMAAALEEEDARLAAPRKPDAGA